MYNYKKIFIELYEAKIERQMNMTKRFGFTLAEVLITLGIIGVVAAMTIPTLMNSTGQTEMKTGFKKIISTLNQAVTMNVALEVNDFSVLTETGTATTNVSLYALFTNRMDVISTTTGVATTANATSYLGDASNYTLFFSDGMAISWPQAAVSCNQTRNCKALVDVNGVKRPNTLTTNSTQIHDQFPILLYDQQVVPNSATARSILYGGV